MSEVVAKNKGIMKWSLIILAIVCSSIAVTAEDEDWINYEDLTELHFTSGQYAYRKRSEPVPQLQCVEGCNSKNIIVTIHCKRRSINYKEIIEFEDEHGWKCRAKTKESGSSSDDGGYHIDYTDIKCEGYDSDYDRRVRRGSCSLYYGMYYDDYGYYGNDDWDNVVSFIVILLLIIGFIVVCSYDGYHHWNYGYPYGYIRPWWRPPYCHHPLY